MNELKVPTRRISVDVLIEDGARATGSMFHAEKLHQTNNPEDIVDELNDERTFVPFSPDDASLGDTLVNKKHILRIHIHDLPPAELRPEEVDALARTDPCTLVFGDGTRVTGRILNETPVACSRLVDRLNQAPPFLTFVTAEGVELINRDQIFRIIPDR